MSYEFHPEALSEFQESAVFYESQQAGLGARFIAAVQSAVDRIVASPQSCRVMEENVRRCLARVFPYAVLYTVENDCIGGCHALPSRAGLLVSSCARGVGSILCT